MIKTKKLFITFLFGVFLIALIGNVSAIYEAHGLTMSGTDSGNTNNYAGFQYTPNQTIIIYNITKHASDASTIGAIRYGNDNTTVITTASFVSDIANFSAPITLSSGVAYTFGGLGDDTPQMSVGTSFPFHLVYGTIDAGMIYNASTYTGNLWTITQIGIVIPPTAPPIVDLLSPVNGFNNTANINYLVGNVTAGTGTTIFNVSLYFNGTINQTNTSALSGVPYNFSIAIPDGDWNWSITAYSNASSKTDSATRNISVGDFFMISNTYNPFSLEQTSQTFYMNFTKRASLSVSAINLTYNQTNYSATFSLVNSTFVNTTATITLPVVTADINKTFNWSVLMTDLTLRNSSSFQQQVQDLGVDDCGTHTVMILNFTMFNETDQLNMSNLGDNTSIRIDLNLYPNASQTVSTIMFSKLYTKINPARVCISDGLGTSVFYIDAQVQYDADGYANEFYNIQNYSLNASSNPSQNISLYSLNDSLSQVYVISYKDANFLPVTNALVQVQRKYIDEGVFKTVEIPLTDLNGEALAHLVSNDVVYTFTITKNGTILATFSDVRAICQNPLIETCRISLNSFASTIGTTDFATGSDFSYTLTYDAGTRQVSSTFSIPSGAVSWVSLNITVEDALQTSVCNEQVTTSSGTLTCTIPSTFGNSTVLAKVYKNGVLQGQGQVKLDQNPSDIYVGSQIIIGLLLILTIIGAAVSDTPVYSVIFFIVGVILLFALNIVANNGFIGTTATILYLVIAVIIAIIKGGNRS